MFLTPSPLPSSEEIRGARFEISPRLVSSGCSRTGLSRPHNEDSFRCDDHHRVYAVADGIGGRPHGEVASDIAVGSICRAVAAADGCHRGSGQVLEDALIEAHGDICRAMSSSSLVDLRGMGSTLVALHFSDNRIARIAHVGDSRAYRLRAGELRRLTSDHTLDNELAAVDQIALAKKFSGSFGHVLTRAVGLRDGSIEVANLAVASRSGDTFLLCSDGLCRGLDDDMIASCLGADSDPGSICDELVTRAQEQGSRDDVTAVVVKLIA